MGSTVINGNFEWDFDKAASNLVKHGVSFEEAATVFADPHACEVDDGNAADRLATIGYSAASRIILVVFVDVGARDRIIGARKATPAECALYRG